MTGCSSSEGDASVRAGAGVVDAGIPSSGSAQTADASTPTSKPTPSKSSSGRVRLAFGGDVHFAGSSASALGGNIGSVRSLLKSADLGIVNLETAITERGTPEPKEYTFRAPATGLDALRGAGVDVVTVANNHGMDYGQVGLADTLAAGKQSGIAMIGAGKNADAAYAPFTKTVKGVRISVLGATDVLDSFAYTTWPATDTKPGLASAKDTDRLVQAVEAAAADSDVVVVVLHWGVEMQSCPSDRQKELAQALTEAGADVVVGSHAHVLEPHVEEGRTAIHYGLGNFVFYATRAQSVQTGVYTVVVDKDGVVGAKWHPALIQGGRPQLLKGADAKAASAREDALAVSCRL